MDKEHSVVSRRRVLGGVAGVGVSSISGCATVENAIFGYSDGGDVEESDDDESLSAADVHVGMVYSTGGLDDKSFNDIAHRGVQRSRLQRDISFDYWEPEDADEMNEGQQEFAESTDPEYELICCIGFDQTAALEENAPNYGDQKFVLVDSVVEAENVASYVFKEHEGSFLAGSLAAQMTTTEFSAGRGSTRPDDPTVGFVGGMEVPLIKKFEAGFAAGADHANSDVEVLMEYVGSFVDTESGREAAERMYDDGADIVYHAAGGAGIGVFQAAQDRERFAVGVDADQSRSDPRFSDVILASMTKRVDTAVYDSIGTVVDDEFRGGSVVPLGLEENGVAIVYGSELGDEIPDDLRTDIEETRQAIVDGDIEVPSEP